MAFMVIHLWGKFWMAAWRGRRAMTWVTGVVAFLASVVECFTGYLSQQNFDAQWISTNGKDAINATGLGAFFNLMNFGQMLMWHIVLLPLVLVAIVGAHVLLVRVRGVAHPLPERRRPRTRGRRRCRCRRRRPIGRGRHAATTSSRRVPWPAWSSSCSWWPSPACCPRPTSRLSRSRPGRGWPRPTSWRTAASELAGTSETANYGPPYNNGTANLQRIGVSWQLLAGVRQPIDAASTFVLSPLSKARHHRPALAAPWPATRQQRPPAPGLGPGVPQAAGDKVTFTAGRRRCCPWRTTARCRSCSAANCRSHAAGGLDSDLLAQQPFYGTNFTKPLLFLEDGSYFASQATAQHLTGSQWGVMNETGSYPGQPWLWLYTLWYQLPGFKTLRQRGPDSHLPHGSGHDLAVGDPVHPRPARHPPPGCRCTAWSGAVAAVDGPGTSWPSSSIGPALAQRPQLTTFPQVAPTPTELFPA